MKHIHIVGCSPRSGTTLLHELITTCFYVDDYCDHEKSIFRVSGLSGDVVCTKSPREIPYMKWLLRVNPNLHVLYLLRDPRSVITSRHRGNPNQYYSSLKLWKDFESYRKKIEHHPRFLTVKYEDMVSEPDRTQEKIQNTFPFLRKKHLFSEFHLYSKPSDDSVKALNGLRPISADGLDKWKNHLPRIKAQLERFGDISDDLIDLGYEQDKQWMTMLDDVKPDHGNSTTDTSYRPPGLMKMKYRIFRKTVVYAFGRLFK